MSKPDPKVPHMVDTGPDITVDDLAEQVPNPILGVDNPRVVNAARLLLGTLSDNDVLALIDSFLNDNFDNVGRSGVDAWQIGNTLVTIQDNPEDC